MLNRLREDGRLSASDFEMVVLTAQRAEERAEEALLTSGLFDEAALLKVLAGIYKTRFVSTKALENLAIDKGALTKLPVRVAERLQAFPVAFEQKHSRLSVVVAAPGEDDVEKQVQVVTGVREVKAYVARPAAIQAAIQKFYHRDPRAFRAVQSDLALRPGPATPTQIEPTRHADAPAPAPPPPAAAPLEADPDDPFAGVLDPVTPAAGVDRGGIAIDGFEGFDTGRHDVAPDTGRQTVGRPDTGRFDRDDFPIDDAGADLTGLAGLGEPGDLGPPPNLTEPKPPSGPFARQSQPSPAGGTRPLPLQGGVIPLDEPIPPMAGASTGPAGGIAQEAYLETLKAFAAQLERHLDRRGHTSRVARVCRKVADRLGMSDDDRHALLVAAYLHDVGKGEDHLTLLNVARSEGHRVKALKSREIPIRLFASAQLPDGTEPVLSQMYERWDGAGFPDRVAGKDIAYGARVLALVDTYADLVANPGNPYGKMLTVGQALQVVKELGGQLFDPTLTDLLRHVVRGEDGVEGEDQPLVLLCDPDPEDTTVLEMHLLELGYRVRVARDYPSARELLTEKPDVVVSEVDLGPGPDGFELMGHCAKGDERPGFLFVSAHSDAEYLSKAFDLGANDYLVKPATPEIVATKAKQAIEAAVRSAGGFSGSLKEMALPDVVQILSNGRKTGRLQVIAGSRRGEVLFGEGQVHDATFGSDRGEEAFYAMLKLSDGTFALDPSVTPTERKIHTSAEGLLLEGMRRMDEGL